MQTEYLEYFAPRVSADTKGFWDNCKEHKLIVQRCKACGKLRWPASYVCPECLSDEVEIVELPQEGTLYSYTVFHKPFHPSMKEKVPYVVCEVDFEGGVRLVSNLVHTEGKEIECGKKVRLRWQDFETYTKPVFEIEEA